MRMEEKAISVLRTGLIGLVALIGLSGCFGTVQFVEPYDAQLDTGLQNHRTQVVALMADLKQAEDPVYTQYQPRYNTLSAELDTLQARARLLAKDTNEEACVIPQKVYTWVNRRLSVPNLGEGDTQLSGNEDAEGTMACSLNQLTFAQERLTQAQNLHYCAYASEDAADFATRCPYGQVQINADAVEELERAWLQSVDIAWAIELAKKDEES